MNLLKKTYAYAKDKLLRETDRSREKYINEFYVQLPEADGEDEISFERALEVASAFRTDKSLRKYKRPGSPRFGHNSYHYTFPRYRYLEKPAKFAPLPKELPKDDPFALAIDTWMNIEAFISVPDKNYAAKAKEDADRLIGMMGPYKSVVHRQESDAEEQLVVASSLLKLYELSKIDGYRAKAEGILDFFAEAHMEKEKIIKKLKIEIDGKDSVRYIPLAKTEERKNGAGLKNLAAITYLNAYRVMGKYEQEAKRLFEASDKSLLTCSEASLAFKGDKHYSKQYKELLKRELEQPNYSASNLAGVVHKPLFGVEADDPTLLKDMFGANFALAMGFGFIDTILPFFTSGITAISPAIYGTSLALSLLANTVAAPYIGRLADKYGKKKILAAEFAVYSAAIGVMPLSITEFAEAGLIPAQAAYVVSGMTSLPVVNSLITDAVPEGDKTKALSDGMAAYSGGYTIGAFLSGHAFEFIKSAQGPMKVLPFVGIAVPPAIVVARLMHRRKENELRKNSLADVFGKNLPQK